MDRMDEQSLAHEKVLKQVNELHRLIVVKPIFN